MASVADVLVLLVVVGVLVAVLEGVALIGALGLAAGRLQAQKRRIGLANLVGAGLVFAVGLAMFFGSQCALDPAAVVAFYVLPVVHLGIGAKVLAGRRVRRVAGGVALLMTGWWVLAAMTFASFALRCALCPAIVGRGHW
jgi:hypothetical protein